MIRKTHKHKPVYREVIRDAFEVAWREPRFWILAFFASLLTTAGLYDVLWTAATNITVQGGHLAKTFGGAVIYAASIPGKLTTTKVIHILGSVEILALITLLILFAGALSCVGQGGLIYAIGAKKRGRTPKLSEAFHVGGKALWPIVVLNVLVLGVIWLLRFLGSLPLYYVIQNPTSGAYYAHIASFSLSLLLIFFVAIVEIFALNALILQGATLSDAIGRGWDLFKKNWLIVIETAVLQLILAIAIWLLFMIAFSIIVLPLYVFLLSASLSNSAVFFGVAFALGGIVFIGALFVLTAFTIQFQYATWTLLYRRLGEGGAVAKLHRWLRSATGSFSIKQS